MRCCRYRIDEIGVAAPSHGARPGGACLVVAGGVMWRSKDSEGAGSVRRRRGLLLEVSVGQSSDEGVDAPRFSQRIGSVRLGEQL